MVAKFDGTLSPPFLLSQPFPKTTEYASRSGTLSYFYLGFKTILLVILEETDWTLLAAWVNFLSGLKACSSIS